MLPPIDVTTLLIAVTPVMVLIPLLVLTPVMVLTSFYESGNHATEQ
ncbi:MAG: hypothetical protein K0U36_03025 [Alphaproteobacteria bacterium]|nr:hypothetical protein [Alphaproteobacteria bacterium]